MLCKSFQIIVLCFISIGFSFGQRLDKSAQREIERNMVFPEKARVEKESCIVLVKRDKDEYNRDTLMMINDVRDYFRESVINGLRKANKDSLFNSIDQRSLIIISFVYFDDEQFIGDQTIKYSIDNVSDVIIKIKGNRNNIIYDPIVIVGYSNKVTRD